MLCYKHVIDQSWVLYAKYCAVTSPAFSSLQSLKCLCRHSTIFSIQYSWVVNNLYIHSCFVYHPFICFYPHHVMISLLYVVNISFTFQMMIITEPLACSCCEEKVNPHHIELQYFICMCLSLKTRSISSQIEVLPAFKI